jgi:TrmH family RNA methyltransferase
MATEITSLQNERVRSVGKLEKRRARDARRVTLVEGTREVARALAGGVIPVEAFVCPSLVKEAEAVAALEVLEALDGARRTHLFLVTPEIFARLVVREGSGGLLLVIPYVTRALAELPVGSPSFLAVIEGVEKPGNLGAILRTADAAGVDGVIVNAGATDVHNPNVVRASLGTLFSVPICEATPAQTVAWLRSLGARAIAAVPDAQQRYTDADMRGPVAIIMGSEAYGLSREWRDAADALVAIPMHGVADSLNLATATALMLYEVVRQRAAAHA